MFLTLAPRSHPGEPASRIYLRYLSRVAACVSSLYFLARVLALCYLLAGCEI